MAPVPSAYGFVKKGDYVLLERGDRVAIVDYVDPVAHYTPDISVRIPEGVVGQNADSSKGVRIKNVEVLDKAIGEKYVKEVRGEASAGNLAPAGVGASSMFGGGHSLNMQAGSGSGFRNAPQQSAFNQGIIGSGARGRPF